MKFNQSNRSGRRKTSDNLIQGQKKSKPEQTGFIKFKKNKPEEKLTKKIVKSSIKVK